VRARRWLTTGIWVVTTLAATGLAWAATSAVAGDVTDRPARVLAAREVAKALRVDPAGTAVATTVAPLSTTTSVVARRPAARPSTTVARPVTTPAPPPTTVTTAAPTTTPTTTTAPQPVVAGTTLSTAGGVITTSCSGFFIHLVAVTPTDGYSVDVLDRGPATVDVHLIGPPGTAAILVRLVCFGGQPIRIPDQHPGTLATSSSWWPF
jgi:hypothetical protein